MQKPSDETSQQRRDSVNGIAEMRKRAGMKQQDLADALHIDRSTVSKLETGEAFPTGNKLPQVAKALKCEIGELFAKEEKKRNKRKQGA